MEEDPALCRLTSQRAFARQLREARAPLLAHALLRTRLSRWVMGDPAAPFPQLLPARAKATLRKLSVLPAAVRWAVIRVWLNGVPTQCRFQQRGRCLLCNVAEDKVEHWPRCSAIQAAGVSPLSLPRFRSPLAFFLLQPDAADTRSDCAGAVLLYSAVAAHNEIRVGRRRAGAPNLVRAWVCAAFQRFRVLLALCHARLIRPRAAGRAAG